MNRIAKTNEVEVFVATNMLAVTADRIFTQGKDASNKSLGKYSDSYMTIRKKTSWGGNDKIILQGVDRKPKGTRSKPNKRGTTKYFATGQMAMDWSVIPAGNVLGLGFKNSANADKSEWVESTYKKDIFKHTKEELRQIDLLVGKKIKQLLNG